MKIQLLQLFVWYYYDTHTHTHTHLSSDDKVGKTQYTGSVCHKVGDGFHEIPRVIDKRESSKEPCLSTHVSKESPAEVCGAFGALLHQFLALGLEW